VAVSIDSELRVVEPVQSALTVAHVVYALHAIAILLGVMGSPTVVGSFVGSVPSIIAVILNYMKRHNARGTWLDSHYRWQIRTFWFAFFWLVIAAVLLVTVVAIPISIAIMAGVGIWLIYRIARGWLRLADKLAMYS
jgi:uncharacterized membrane protein